MTSIQSWFRATLNYLLSRMPWGAQGPPARAGKPALQSRTAPGAGSGEKEVQPAEAAEDLPVPNLDGKRILSKSLDSSENALLARISCQVESGQFELPQLPATTLALVNLAGKPGVDVGRLVELISSDPTLASELLRVSNSVLYATHVPAGTLNEAVMRIGLKGLRALVYSISIKGTILKVKDLSAFSTEVWRQAFSVASIARKIAPPAQIEPERAFLIGLLHDVGKIALLAMLSKEMQKGQAVSPATVGRVFYTHHERAGLRLAQAWRLDEELTSIAGNHHAFADNEQFAQGAALASLAHKIDLHMSFDDESSFRALVRAPEFECLGISEERRPGVLEVGRRAFNERLEAPKPAAA